MSVLLKGMNMPRDGERLKVWIEANGQVIVDKRTYYEEYEAVEIPDHGDLVDRDELMMKMWEASAYAPNHCSWVNARVVFAKDIEDAPVVIPAERSEE